MAGYTGSIAGDFVFDRLITNALYLGYHSQKSTESSALAPPDQLRSNRWLGERVGVRDGRDCPAFADLPLCSGSRVERRQRKIGPPHC